MVALDPKKMLKEAVQKAQDCFKVGELEYGQEILVQVLRCDPDNQAAIQLLGIFHHKCRRYREAIPFFEKAISLDPSNPDNYNNLALCQTSVGHTEIAIANLEKAISINPNDVKYHNNLALQYRRQKNYDKALEALNKAVEIDPNDTQVWSNLGGIYGETRDLDKAIECYKTALSLDPNMASAHVDLAYTYHMVGNYKEAWKEYEYRFDFFDHLWFYNNRYNPALRWKTHDLDLTNKTIILYCEQGLGDTLNFVRYIPILKDRFDCKVILHCSDNLQSLLRASELGINEFFTVPIVIMKPEHIPPHDHHASLMSLPYLLDLNFIPRSPYLKPTVQEKVDLGYEGYKKIGICWAGSPQHPNDSIRSCYLNMFRDIHDLPGVKLYSLQENYSARIYPNGMTPVDYTEKSHGMKIVDLRDHMSSFENTANLLTGLDLVITVDTALLHLCGALGIPTIGLISYLPDWRWGTEGETTPWYDSVTLARQQELGDWKGLFETVLKKVSG
jgi:tetratricopeptide (TPR) repeat protein